MDFRDDERGQAIQVGAVLLFAILIVAFSTYQAVIIPADNRRVEFNHNQEVQDQLADLRSAILSTTAASGPRSVTVALGTQYPSRTLGLNPNSPGGSLRTVGTTDPAVALTIENATASGETGDLWDGDAISYNTGAIRYSPIYNRYDEAPRTLYEHSTLSNRFSAGNALVLANQTFVDGDRLSIVTVNGSLDRTASTSTSVDVRPVSSSSETILVEAAGSNSPLTLTFTSTMSASEWERILSDESNVVDVSGSSSPAGSDFSEIRVELATGVTYRLGMAKAAVGQGATAEGSAYLTDENGDGANIQRGTTQQVTLSVRDRYNNPVGGVTVNGSVDGANAGSLDSNQGTTGSDGQVTFTYNTTSSTTTGTHTLQFTTDDQSVLAGGSFDGTTPDNVTMSVAVTASGGGGSGGGAYALSWADPSGQDGVTCPNGPDGTCSIDASTTATVTLVSATSPSVTGASLDYALNDSSLGELDPGVGETNATGENDTELTVLGNGALDVIVTGGGGSDTITFSIANQVADLVYNGDASAQDGPDSDGTAGGVEFSVTNQFGQEATITEMTINETSSQVRRLNDEASPNGQARTSEIYVDGDVDDGWVDVNAGFDLPTTVDLDQTGFTNGPNPTTSAGGTFTVYLYEFENNGGNRVDMSGRSFSVTLDYQLADGTTGQKKIDVTVP